MDFTPTGTRFPSEPLKPIRIQRLMAGSCLTMAVSGLTFAVRGDTIGALGNQFSLNHQQLGWIAGAAFWGFVVSVTIAGQICDLIGMRRLMGLGCILHVAGVVLTMFAVGFWTLWLGTLSIGMGNAAVEGAVNPLIATIYSGQKTQKLNTVHAWFPWGIVSGGLAAFAMTKLGLGWQAKMCLILIPALTYGFIFLGQTFPATERVQLGIPAKEMYREALRPRFLVWISCMLLTASTELGPNQWIPNILTRTSNFPGILILAWINSLMAIGRTFAGRWVHRLSSLGLLISAAVLSASGLIALSMAHSALAALGGSTIFALGVCYFWPTMLALTAEWFPAGGAFLLALMGGAGNLSVALILPAIGRVYDTNGPALALREVAVLPLLLVLAFTAIWYRDRNKPIRSTQHALVEPQT
ncbi:MAG: MFS transporter [Bryobacteraceae bacterium]